MIKSKVILKKAFIIYEAIIILFFSFSVSSSHTEAVSLDSNYEAATPYVSVSYCAGSPGDGRTYCRRNCTSYVAYKLATLGVTSPHYQLNGNGNQWRDRTAAKGIPHGSTPKVGAVAYWNSGGNGYGHVGWVESVNSDGSVNTSNYNGLTGSFYRQSSARPEGYIYFSNVDTTNPYQQSSGTPDIYAINRRDAGSGKTAYHVINGANPSQFLRNAGTVLHQTDSNWDFDVADYNKDGTPDIYAINRRDAGSGKTAYHVINGANPSQFLQNTPTILHQTDFLFSFIVYNFDNM